MSTWWGLVSNERYKYMVEALRMYQEDQGMESHGHCLGLSEEASEVEI